MHADQVEIVEMCHRQTEILFGHRIAMAPVMREEAGLMIVRDLPNGGVIDPDELLDGPPACEVDHLLRAIVLHVRVGSQKPVVRQHPVDRFANNREQEPARGKQQRVIVCVVADHQTFAGKSLGREIVELFGGRIDRL